MKLLLDIEVYPNLFYVGIKNYETKESTAFEVSEHIDQRSEIYEFLNSCEKHKDFVITFNGIDYDMIVLGYFYSQYYKLLSLSPEQCCLKIKNLSDQLIDDDNFDTRNMYKYVFKRIINIDLYKYWAKMLRLSKKLSLKSLGIQLNYHTVQELPYNPATYLTYEEGLEVKHYCSVHDIGILELLTDKLRDEINLRKTIVQDYDIPAWSMDAPKIASEALLKDYCNITGQNTKDVSKMRFERPTIKFGELLKDIPVEYISQDILKTRDKWLRSIDEFNESFIVFNSTGEGVKISVGIGGIPLCPLI